MNSLLTLRAKSGQTKINDDKVRVFGFVAKQKVFWFKISVNNVEIVTVVQRVQDTPHETRGIVLAVVPLYGGGQRL